MRTRTIVDYRNAHTEILVERRNGVGEILYGEIIEVAALTVEDLLAVLSWDEPWSEHEWKIVTSALPLILDQAAAFFDDVEDDGLTTAALRAASHAVQRAEQSQTKR